MLIHRQSLEKLSLRLSEYIPSQRLLKDEPMSRHTTFRIGGPADLVLLPASSDEIVRAMDDCAELGIPVFVMGNGSNLLVRDGGIRGLVIIIGEAMSRIKTTGAVMSVHAGAALTRLSREAQTQGLDGLACASGIPGTVGGAVAMNAGAYGGQISDVLQRALVITDRTVRWFDASQLNLGYRSSLILSQGMTVVEAEFALKPGDPAQILSQMNDLAVRRREKQPLSLPSAGSTFKRPEGYFAGALIEGAGLKGCRVGGAEVSQLHAGFIVNRGGATARDVLSLIEHIRQTVYQKDGVLLEPELRILGED